MLLTPETRPLVSASSLSEAEMLVTLSSGISFPGQIKVLCTSHLGLLERARGVPANKSNVTWQETGHRHGIPSLLKPKSEKSFKRDTDKGQGSDELPVTGKARKQDAGGKWR